MRGVPKIQAGNAILDVERGRTELNKQLRHFEIPVTVTGYIRSEWGDWDGVSQEFQVEVTGVAVEQDVMKWRRKR